MKHATNNATINHPSNMLTVAHQLNRLCKHTSKPFTSNDNNIPYQYVNINNDITPQVINNNANNHATT